MTSSAHVATLPTVRAPAPSATLAIDAAVAARRAAGSRVLHLGFGEAGLPAPPGVIEVLAGAARRTGYGPVVGGEPARTAAAGWFARRGLPTTPDQICFAPGSKPLLFALLCALDRDVVLPRPAWVSYAAQAGLLGRRVVPVPIGAEVGGVPDPDLLEAALRAARSDGADPGVLVLTVPDNPTGTVADIATLQRVCDIADRHGLAVVADEIYAELVHDGASPAVARILPERTVVTTGLSKSLALGGWRIGFARTPDTPWGRALRAAVAGVASEVWSSLAAPMQAVATHALGDPAELTAHIAASRRLHGRVARAVHARLLAAGLACRPPRAGFYLYPDFAPARAVLAEKGITTSRHLATELLETFGVATLPGAVFGDDETVLTLRIATSLLYGEDDEQRQAALAADAPEALPWIADSLDTLRRVLDRLLTGARAPG